MKQRKFTKEMGQSLVIFAVAIVAIVAMLALVLDGGFAFVNRRTAQNAADSGALAGARVYCVTEDISAAQFAAQDYAVNKNGASSITFSVDEANRTVTVKTQVPFNTFFASSIGTSNAIAEAEASAACVKPGLGEGVLPIAWSCHKPIGGSDSDDCEIQTITWDEYLNYVDNPPALGTLPPELYVIMEDKKTSTDHCAPPWGEGTIDCDQDDDGDPEFLPDGGRSWLNLDGGGGGAAELANWIKNGYDFDLFIHTWVPDQEGTDANLFKVAATRYGDPLALPVIDDLCDKEPAAFCPSKVHPNGSSTAIDTIKTGAGYKGYYHIDGFAAFVIYCVAPQKSWLPSYYNKECPGHYYGSQVAKPALLDKNAKVIEGFFIRGFIPGLSGGGGGGVYTDTYVLLLTK